MRYNNEIQGLMKNPRYKYARQVFDALLSGGALDVKVLKKLYKSSYSRIIELSNGHVLHGIVRPHDAEAPCNISDARIAIGKNKEFQSIHNRLLLFMVPDIKILNKFFGENSRTVQESYRMFIEAKKLRKSGISMTCHHNRVACTFFQMNKDNPDIKWYASVAALHDFVEDLMYVIKDEHGDRYTIEHYHEFINKFIPKDLQEPVKLLTNHYDMILKYVDYHLDKAGKRFNKDNLLEFLENIGYGTYEQLRSYIMKIMDIVKNYPYAEMSSKNYLEEIKWECYSRLYIPELITISYNDKEELLLMIKLIDLSDNNHALDGVDIIGKIKNINKSVITADYISRLDKARLLDAYVREIREDALVKAEFLVIKDLMHQDSVQDFFVDALLKIEKMKDVFYKSQ